MPSPRRPTPTPTPVACAAVAAGALLAGCGAETTALACPASRLPAVVAEVRDPDGAPIARGAQLALRSVVLPRAPRDTATGAGDDLRVAARTSRVGIYTVTVSRAGYAPVVVEDVVAPGGACGVERSIVVPVTLEPAG